VTTDAARAAEVDGHVADGFGPVADAFRANFTDAGEVGAAVAVYAGGELVVDLWGGTADPATTSKWRPDTLSVIFSCSKGIVTLCVYALVQDGLLDLDAPVARYWPEFAHNGKQDITVRTALSHRAGLPTVEAELSFEEVLAWTPVIDALAAQAPRWKPGTGFFYHALTFGWLAGEVIRRVSGQMPGDFLRSRFTGPLDLDTWIGLPADKLGRLAPVVDATLPTDPDVLAEQAVFALTEAAVIGERSVTLDGALMPPAGSWAAAFNRPAVAQAQLPGGNGISTARGLAGLYSAAVHGPDRFLRADSVSDALVVRSEGAPLFGGEAGDRWGTGFVIGTPGASPLLGPRSFGHGGAGGKAAFGDDSHDVGFAYLNNWMGTVPDERASRIITALAGCL
jgi:CubicO group peptidase (beta-lactamase class C family)